MIRQIAGNTIGIVAEGTEYVGLEELSVRPFSLPSGRMPLRDPNRDAGIVEKLGRQFEGLSEDELESLAALQGDIDLASASFENARFESEPARSRKVASR